MDVKDYRLRNDNGNIVFEGYTGTDERFRMPDGVTEIAERAFAGNKCLKHIDLGDVVTVGGFAFQECSNLETVVMDHVRIIGPGAFEFCRSLRSISIDGLTSIGDYAFRHCRQLNMQEIPRSLVSLGAGVFSHTAIRTVCLDWLKEIPAALFSGSSDLTYAELSGARVIGKGAFEECGSLATVRFSAAEIIRSRAFYKCRSFEVSALPDTLHAIGDEAFGKTRAGLIVPGNVRSFGRNCFGPAVSMKSISIYRSSLYDFRNYFIEEKHDDEGEDEHFYLWESSLDIAVLDDKTDALTGYLPLFTDIDRGMKAKLMSAFRPDNSFDYQFIDTELFDGLGWNRRCMDSVAFKRLKYPYELSETARIKYSNYLKNHSKRIAKSAVRDNDSEVLAFLFDNDLIDQKMGRDILDYSISVASHDCTAFLLERTSAIQETAIFLPGEL